MKTTSERSDARGEARSRQAPLLQLPLKRRKKTNDCFLQRRGTLRPYRSVIGDCGIWRLATQKGLRVRLLQYAFGMQHCPGDSTLLWMRCPVNSGAQTRCGVETVD